MKEKIIRPHVIISNHQQTMGIKFFMKLFQKSHNAMCQVLIGG
jgi:hypothetical protein